jgi:hypothetical protein
MSVTHHQVRLELQDRRFLTEAGTALSTRTKAFIATTIGLAGGLAMALPLIVYGWASSAHSALELPMAATSWMFSLHHFTQNGYEWSSIAFGTLLLAAYAIAHGVVFGGFADRFLRLTTVPEAIGAGLAWGFVSWLFFWYTMLPIARGGAPFHAVVGPLARIWGIPAGVTVSTLPWPRPGSSSSASRCWA